eukprot:TRINITY_DN5108_c0_g1_i1.p1 TRINITY_DN5108_c0_g1~~TRINITY_DN5108_c0_g1_i1.p1  ORF type:complete len:324 (-),score=80.20 TRINITY_DN5108_c0_g1_i1:113-1084(-)
MVSKYPQYLFVNFDCLEPCGSLQNVAMLERCKNYHFVKGNILSSDLVSYVLRFHSIDTVVHFAAQSHVDHSFGNSFVFTKTNILGTHVLLENSSRANIKLFVHVSTDEVYGETAYEDNATVSSVLEPTNPYAASKAGAEFLVKSYHRSFGLPTVITRGNNVYGPYQYPEKLIPKCIHRLLRGLPCCIHGDGSHQRAYLHVDDVAAAFDVIMHHGLAGRIYNIGTSEERSNLDVAKEICRIFGKDPDSNIEFVNDRAINDVRYSIDSKALLDFGWRPTVQWKEGIAQTVQWYRENEEHWGDVQDVIVPHPVFHVYDVGATLRMT